MNLIPPALKPGDRIAVIAPAGNLKDFEAYRTGCGIISSMGFEIAERDKCWPGKGYLSDHDVARLAEFHRVWSDPSIMAIIALRGGYGCSRILPGLDLSTIAKHPKLLIGFSDISILLNHLYRQTGLVCLHGPVLTSLSSGDQQTHERLYHCLTGNWHRSLTEKVEIVRPAPPARGPLIGGNLSSLVSLLGTPFQPDFSDCILFLEDVNEPLYRLDRMLTQISQTGAMSGIKGIICGDFSADHESGKSDRLQRHEFVWQRISELTDHTGVPIWGNFPAGHSRTNITLPIGAEALMDCGTGTLLFPA